MSEVLAPAGRFSDAELDDIRDREPVSVVLERFGVRVRRAGKTHLCACFVHAEKTPSCTVDDRKGLFFCHGCGQGGDVIKAVMLIRGCGFPDAVEMLGGVRELTDADRAEIERRKAKREAEAAEEARKVAAAAARLWGSGQSIRGTHADEYLMARGLMVPGGAHLRFVPGLAYWGWAEEGAREVTNLGAFPAMLGAIRNPAGDLIGVHRTYLDPHRPEKLKPPGDRVRNRAKKITGEQRGGQILLTAPAEKMAYGEGIETTLSWPVLMNEAADGYGLAALVSLGNICGGATEHVAHPSKRHPDGRPVLIPNGTPDFSLPGFVPGPGVRVAVLLGDGDSDRAGTRRRLQTAALRWEGDPDRRSPLKVGLSMAADGFDFNDLLQQAAERM